MLRIRLTQQRYALSGPAMDVAHSEVESMRRLTGMSLASDALSGETDDQAASNNKGHASNMITR